MMRQGIDKNVFDGLAMSGMIPIHAATALSAAKMNPVGGFIAGSTIASAFNQGFKQQRPVTVQSFPIIRQTMSGKRKNLAGKTTHGNIRRNNEAAIGNDELKIPFLFFSTPSDPGVSRRHFQCRTGKLKAGEIPARQFVGFDEIAQMSAERDFVAKIMPASNELFEDRSKLPISSLNKLQGQRFELACAAGNRRFIFDECGGVCLARPRGTTGSKFRNGDDAVGVKTFKQNTAFFVFELPVRPFPVEQFRKSFGQFGEAEIRKGFDGLTNEVDLIGGKGTTG